MQVRVEVGQNVQTIVPVTFAQFSLVFEDRSVRAAVAVPNVQGVCAADQALVVGGSATCNVYFDVAEADRFQAVAFLDPTSGIALETATPIQEVPVLPELNLQSLPAEDLRMFCEDLTYDALARDEGLARCEGVTLALAVPADAQISCAQLEFPAFIALTVTLDLLRWNREVVLQRNTQRASRRSNRIHAAS